MRAPRGGRSLLRRLPGAQGAALTVRRGPDLTHTRAPAVAVVALAGLLWLAPPALADETTPPPTTPTGTTPDAPPPDPYRPPVTAKPKSAVPKRSAPVVVHSAPAARTRSYSPPVTAAAPVRRAPTHRVAKEEGDGRQSRGACGSSSRDAEAGEGDVRSLYQPRRVGRHPCASGPTKSPRRYLWAAGLAFAVLAVAGLSLHVLSVRLLRVRGALR